VGVWGVLMSIVILQESVSLLQITGGFLTVIGVVLAQMTQIRKKPSEDLITPRETAEND